jgi:hypothetical protein
MVMTRELDRGSGSFSGRAEQYVFGFVANSESTALSSEQVAWSKLFPVIVDFKNVENIENEEVFRYVMSVDL